VLTGPKKIASGKTTKEGEGKGSGVEGGMRFTTKKILFSQEKKRGRFLEEKGESICTF